MIFEKMKLKSILAIVQNNLSLLQTIDAKLDKIMNYLTFLEQRLAEYGIEVEKRSLH